MRTSVGALPSSLRLVPAHNQQYGCNMAWEPWPIGAAVTHAQWEPLEILRLLVSALPCLARSCWGWTATAQQARGRLVGLGQGFLGVRGDILRSKEMMALLDGLFKCLTGIVLTSS